MEKENKDNPDVYISPITGQHLPVVPLETSKPKLLPKNKKSEIKGFGWYLAGATISWWTILDRPPGHHPGVMELLFISTIVVGVLGRFVNKSLWTSVWLSFFAHIVVAVAGIFLFLLTLCGRR